MVSWTPLASIVWKQVQCKSMGSIKCLVSYRHSSKYLLLCSAAKKKKFIQFWNNLRVKKL